MRLATSAVPLPTANAGPQDAERVGYLQAEFDGILLDYSRQRVTKETMAALFALADAAGLKDKIGAMAAGKHINVTENRAVGHMALRAPKGVAAHIDGKDVVPEVHEVLDRIAALARDVRSGARKGITGKPLTDVVSIGIG
jgi:glucose-6-phosphate isomerase